MMTMTSGAAVAAELAPVIRAHADEAERTRQLPGAVVDALIGAGVFRYLVPESLGGQEGEPAGFYALVEALGKVDGSTAWCAYIGGSAPLAGRFVSDEAAETIWADPRTVVAGGLFPPQPITPADGGYRVSGRWPYASGCTHATYVGGGCLVREGEGVRMGPRGPVMHFAVAPRSEVEVLDTWDVMGLAGTGSHDIALEDVFVPEGFVGPLDPRRRGRHFAGPLYRFPFAGLFAFPMGAVALGIAAGVIDEALAAAQEKVPVQSQTTLRERPLFQLQMAEAVATAASARAWLYERVREIWALAQVGEVALPERNTLALAAAHATKSARAAVETAYLASGGSANYNRSPFPRAVRDIHALSQHVATSPQQFPNAGAVLAGLEPPNPILLL